METTPPMPIRIANLLMTVAFARALAKSAPPWRPGRTAKRSPRRQLAWFLILGLIASLAAIRPAMAADERATGERMADAMTRMMDAMGLSESADASMGHTPQAMRDAMPAWPWGESWSGGFGDPVRAFGLPKSLQDYGGAARPWQATTLNGIWEGRNGGLLIVRGYRFRLYQPNAGYIDGLIQQRGDRIALYDPATNSAQPYEFALHRGRLAVRDAAGKLFLYRRLWLEQDAAGHGFSQESPAAAAGK